MMLKLTQAWQKVIHNIMTLLNREYLKQVQEERTGLT